MFISAVTEYSRDPERDAINANHQMVAKKAGIIDKRRYLHIFHDPKYPTKCKIIQINISVTLARHVIQTSSFSNANNGTISYVGVYVYDCKLVGGGSLRDKVLRSEFDLVTVKRFDRDCDHDTGEVFMDEVNVYSSLFPRYDPEDEIDTKPLVDPRYYTQEHEYHSNGNLEGCVMGVKSIPKIYGMHLLDDATEMVNWDMDKFETIKYEMMNGSSDKVEDFSTDILSRRTGDMIFHNNKELRLNSLLNGGIFAYETGLQPVYNHGSIICKKYVSDDHANNQIKRFIRTLTNNAQLLEKEHGPIRVHYTPSLMGSRCEVFFKDYNNHRVTGNADNCASKDGGYEVNEVVQSAINEKDGLQHETVRGTDDYLSGHQQQMNIMRSDGMTADQIMLEDY